MSAGCSRCILFGFNILFFLVGLVPLVIGIIALVDPNTLNKLIDKIPDSDQVTDVIDLPELVKRGAIYITVLGGAIALMGFMGCCGAWCSNRCLLGLYITLIVLFIAAEVALIILAVFFPEEMRDDAKVLMLKTLQEFEEDITINDDGELTEPTHGISLAWHKLQFQIGCCGVYNFTDYQKFGWDNKESQVPVSCCELTSTTTSTPKIEDFKNSTECPGVSGTARFNSINQEPCYDLIEEIIKNSTHIVMGVFGGIILLQVILIVLAGCIFQDESRKQSRGGKTV